MNMKNGSSWIKSSISSNKKTNFLIMFLCVETKQTATILQDKKLIWKKMK